MTTKRFFEQVLITFGLILFELTVDNYCLADFNRNETYPSYPPDYSDRLCTGNGSNAFDYVIVGGGTAGSIMASRLSENTNRTVLLIEFGSNPPAVTDDPNTWTDLLSTSINYRYRSEKNKDFFQGFRDEITWVSQGAVLGGSSSTNGMYYFAPSRADLKRWKQAGNEGWDYEDLLPYIVKSQNFHDNLRYDPTYHGLEGYQHVSRFESDDPSIAVLKKAFFQMGLSFKNDLNRGKSIEYGITDSTTVHGLRASTARGYLSPITLRPNFYLAKRTLARKILLEKRRAIAVELTTVSNGRICNVTARKEIIISAGAIRSPQLLMLSGIGPDEHLREMQIPIVINLPVGRIYRDHVNYFGIVYTYSGNSTDNVTSPSEYLNKGQATAGLGKINAFFNPTDSENDDDIINKLEIQPSKSPKGSMSRLINGHPLLYSSYNVKDDIVRSFVELNSRADNLLFTLALVDPKSRGTVRLKSRNPFDYPRIFTNLLNDPLDMKTMVDGLKWIKKLSETSAMQDYQLQRIDYPACRNYSDFSDEYYECSLKQLASGFYHPHSTVKMGPTDDPEAVVTPDLRVKGIDNLRVVDGSVFPFSISRNIVATIIALAEKAADLVKSANDDVSFAGR